ncbi:MAG: NlpC/P60 family protein [Actinomycetota bacterium]
MKPKLVAVALTLGFLLAPVAGQPSAEAVGGYRVAWTQGHGLSVRTGANTTSASMGRLRDGTSLDLRCYVRGQLINRRNNVWYQLNGPKANGFVTASYVSTPSDPLPGLPRCGSAGSSAPAPAPANRAPSAPAASGHALRAIEWARTQVGQWEAAPDVAKLYSSNWVGGPDGEWSGDCLLFVNHAYRVAGVNTIRAANANGAFHAYREQGRITTTGTPPAGALVFWDTARPYGHVALSVGGGQVITTRGMDGQKQPVQQTSVATFGTPIGWVLP